MSSNLDFSGEEVDLARDALAGLRDDVSEFVNVSGILPTPDSIARKEEADFVSAEPVRTAFSQCMLLMEVGGDQITGMVKMLTTPIESIAPWTLVRALLEASAVAVWVSDPKIDVRQRVARSIALRYEGVVQQRKFLRAAGHPGVDVTTGRLTEISDYASNLGFEPV